MGIRLANFGWCSECSDARERRAGEDGDLIFKGGCPQPQRPTLIVYRTDISEQTNIFEVRFFPILQATIHFLTKFLFFGK